MMKNAFQISSGVSIPLEAVPQLGIPKEDSQIYKNHSLNYSSMPICHGGKARGTRDELVSRSP